MRRNTLLGVLALGTLLINSQTWATTCDGVHITTTLADWKTAGTCTNQDKAYTFDNTSLPTDTPVKFDVTVLAGVDIHTITLDFLNGGLSAAGTYTLDYDLAITDPMNYFIDVSLGANVPGVAHDVRVVKDVTWAGGSTNLTSTSGGDVGPNAIGSPNTIQMVHVHETFLIDQGVASGAGLLVSTTNTFTESVPEPASLSLLGMGLLAFGFRRRAA